MSSDVFADVKEQLDLIDAAEYYGLDVNRGGFISCLFHDEKTPSMKLYSYHFHCFGCGKHGDVIDLTEKLFSLSPLEAAEKLARDFGINTDRRIADKKPTIKEKIVHYSFASQEKQAFKALNGYCDYLEQCRIHYAPKQNGEELHPLFVKSIIEIEKFKYYRDIFVFGDKDERKAFLKDFSEFLGEIEKGCRKVKQLRSRL